VPNVCVERLAVSQSARRLGWAYVVERRISERPHGLHAKDLARFENMRTKKTVPTARPTRARASSAAYKRPAASGPATSPRESRRRAMTADLMRWDSDWA
jgi:hypothetical protein